MQVQKARQDYKLVKSLFGKYEEIPEEWEFKNLGDMTQVTDGSHYSPEKVKNGFSLATVENIKGNEIDINSCYQISKKDYEQLVKDGDQPEIGDVLFTKDGTVGKTLVYKQNERIVLLSSIAIIRKSEKIDSVYCNYALQSKFMAKHLAKYFGGTAIKRIILRHLSKYEFPIPPIEEQQKIASILSNVDSLINQTQKEIEQTQKLKKGLMQKLLTKGIGHTKFKKVKSLFGKYEEIPEEWKLITLGTLCEIRKENNVKSDLYIGLEHIGQGTNTLTGIGNIQQFTSTKNVFRKGDVLYGKLRPLLNKVWLSTKDGFCSTDILPILTKENLDNRILEKILSSDDFVDYASSSSAGTKMPRTNWSDIQKYEIKLPPIIEQQKIASILSIVDSQIQKQQENKSKLETLKKGLMQKLLTGQIRVQC
jgi:type I restriction enzyme S subunit